MKIVIWIVLIILLLFVLCDRSYPANSKTEFFTVNETSWIATNNDVVVVYKDLECPGLGKNVLQNLVDDSNAGVFNWNNMKNSHFMSKMLQSECE
jgi:hypothetical protein